MRKVILFVDMSLDGFMSSADGGLNWTVGDDRMDIELTNDFRRTVDTILVGRKTFESFIDYWPAAAADAGNSAELRDIAQWIVDTPKVVFSKTLDSVDAMANSRLAKGELAEEIARLKGEDGGDLVLFGGSSTVASFVEHGLVDEYRFKLHPVAIGSGAAVFKGVSGKASLKLVHSKVYESGVLAVYYEAQ